MWQKRPRRWREIDPVASKNRGLLSLMRRHRHNLRPDRQLKLTTYLEKYPALDLIYRFKQRLCYLLSKKHRTRRQCDILIPRFLRAVHQLRQAGLAQLRAAGPHSFPLGPARSSPCGASPATTASPRASTTKWGSSIAKPTASATLKTTDCASRYYVGNQFGFWGCPRCWRRAYCFRHAMPPPLDNPAFGGALLCMIWLVGPPGFEPGTSCTPSKRASQAAPRPELPSVAPAVCRIQKL